MLVDRNHPGHGAQPLIIIQCLTPPEITLVDRYKFSNHVSVFHVLVSHTKSTDNPPPLRLEMLLPPLKIDRRHNNL